MLVFSVFILAMRNWTNDRPVGPTREKSISTIWTLNGIGRRIKCMRCKLLFDNEQETEHKMQTKHLNGIQMVRDGDHFQLFILSCTHLLTFALMFMVGPDWVRIYWPNSMETNTQTWKLCHNFHSWNTTDFELIFVSCWLIVCGNISSVLPMVINAQMHTERDAHIFVVHFCQLRNFHIIRYQFCLKRPATQTETRLDAWKERRRTSSVHRPTHVRWMMWNIRMTRYRHFCILQ